jgi:hypothetical protein
MLATTFARVLLADVRAVLKPGDCAGVFETKSYRA